MPAPTVWTSEFLDFSASQAAGGVKRNEEKVEGNLGCSWCPDHSGTSMDCSPPQQVEG